MRRILGTDEKFFVLYQKRHRQKDGKLSRENILEIIASNDRKDKRVVIIVVIVEEKISLAHAFIDENVQMDLL